MGINSLNYYNKLINPVKENTKKFYIFHPNMESSAHGFNHATRVAKNAINIVANDNHSNYNMVVILCACYLHDVDDHKYFNTIDYSNARKIMRKSGISDDIANQVVNCIDQVGYSKNKFNPVNCYEAGVVRDADRLEAMGAMGVLRTFIYSAEVGNTIKDALDHCYEKILHLHEHMCTDYGKKLADERARHAINIVRDVEDEMGLIHRHL